MCSYRRFSFRDGKSKGRVRRRHKTAGNGGVFGCVGDGGGDGGGGGVEDAIIPF